MRFLRFMGSVFCITAICFMCLLAASVFNEELAESLREAGNNALTVIREFSEKAEINVFSESDK